MRHSVRSGPRNRRAVTGRSPDLPSRTTDSRTGLPPRHARSAHQRGLTLFEIVIAMAVLALVTVTSLGLMVGSMQLDATNRENAQALAAATQVVERMQGRSFSQVLSLYNEATSDDPVAGGPAPGARFGVTGLRPSDDDPNVGRVRFPLAADGTLREDLQLPEFGMPMDLNGDGAIDGDDRSSDYVVLPVVIELRWTGRGGPRSLDVHALLMEGS